VDSERADQSPGGAPLEFGVEAMLEADRQMLQVRELLFGEFARQTESRLARMEARIDEIENRFGKRLDALHARLDAFAEQVDTDRRGVVEELSLGVAELSERVRAIGRLRTELSASPGREQR
jgi:two-component sensor histidine kinase